MNILFVTPYLPYPPVSGGRLQIFLRLKYLKKRGHSVFLATLARSDEHNYVAELQTYLDDIEYIVCKPDITKIKYLFRKSLLYEIFTYDRQFGERLKFFAHAKKINVAVFEGLGATLYRDFIKETPAVIYEHNVEHEITGQLVARLRHSPLKIWEGKIDEKMKNLYLWLFGAREKTLVKEFEIDSVRTFDLCLTCSNRDASSLRKDIAGLAPLTIPWCIESTSKYNKPEKREQYNLLFVGSMQWEPNRDAIIWFAKQIFPLIKQDFDNIRLLIVGSCMSEEIQRLDNGKDILVKGYVPEISKVLLEADIFIAPLRLGSGVNVKVIEAMAYGVPVITTSKGAEGLEAENGEHFLIADTPEQFRDAAKRLLESRQMRRSLGKKAREYILSHHRPDNVIDAFEEALLKVVDNHG